MRSATRLLLAAPLALLPSLAAAHPHIFVDTGLTFVLDDAGHLTGVEVLWSYDELYSLLLLEDMGLDSDYDGNLTPQELEQLAGFDMQWVDGYAGDLYLSVDGTPVALGPPRPETTALTEGKIETRHFRPIAAGPMAVPAGGIVVRAYDPTLYTAYDLTRPLDAGPACALARTKADIAAAQQEVARQLDGRPPTIDDFPELGEAFADTLLLTCKAAS